MRDQCQPVRDQCQPEVGWAQLDRATSLAPIKSLDFSNRMRGVRASCTASKPRGRPKRMTAPDYCKIGAAETQRRRLSARTASLASQRPIARGFASRSLELVGRVRHCAWPLKIYGNQQAPIFRLES